MKHQEAIANQRAAALQIGVKQAISYVDGVNKRLNQKEKIEAGEIEEIRNELWEIVDYLTWLSQQ